MTQTTSTQSERHGSSTDPYRLFFPLGIALGIVGTSIWPLFHWGLAEDYSGQAHAFIQTNCFLFAFIVGFLWTAVPRFTGTQAPRRILQLFLAGLLIAEAVALELYYFRTAHALFLGATAIFGAVLIRRFVSRKHPPPETFTYVGFGVLAGSIAAAINAGSAFGVLEPAWDLLGRRLMSEGMVLLLVLGVGGFLGPRLLGFARLPDLQKIGNISPGTRPPAINRNMQFSAAAGFALLASVIVQYGWDAFGNESRWPTALAGFTRAVVATIVILVNVQPWRLPAVRTTLS